MHLLDANVLIRADADFYPLNRIPQFWEWLIEKGENEEVRIPAEIHDEVAAGTGALADWVAEKHVKASSCSTSLRIPHWFSRRLITVTKRKRRGSTMVNC